MSDHIGKETTSEFVAEHLVRVPFIYSTPIFIGILNGAAPPLTASGTATLLQIDDRKMLITDDHVLRMYDELRAADTQFAFQIGMHPFDPHERLIDRNSRKDLCVFDASGLELNDRPADSHMPAIEFYQATSSTWSPQLAQVDDVVIFGGYPGTMRKQDGFDIVSQSYSVAAVLVTGSFPDYYTCNLDRVEWRTGNGKDDPLLQLKEWGGMSGGPSFRDGEGILSPILSGFIMEHSPDIDQVKMSHAALIKANGMIERGSLF